MHWFYYLSRYLLIAILFLTTHRRVTGKENIPHYGPLLIAVNHLNMLDPPLIGISITRKTVFMAKEELFRHWFLRFIVRNLGAFPVHKGRLGGRALKEGQRWLAQGMALVTFPEGKRSRNAQLQAAFAGSALIASRAGAPILPVGISGTEQIKGFTWWLHRPKITVNIGRPFHLTPANGKLNKSELTQLTESIMKNIAGLLPPEYHGQYSKEEEKQL